MDAQIFIKVGRQFRRQLPVIRLIRFRLFPTESKPVTVNVEDQVLADGNLSERLIPELPA